MIACVRPPWPGSLLVRVTVQLSMLSVREVSISMQKQVHGHLLTAWQAQSPFASDATLTAGAFRAFNMTRERCRHGCCHLKAATGSSRLAITLLLVCFAGAVVIAVSSATGRGNRHGWLPDNLNHGRLDLFFLFLAGQLYLPDHCL